MEIERKFIVDRSFIPPEEAEVHILEQGYLCLGDKEEVRLRFHQPFDRMVDGIEVKYYLTVKKGSGLVRGEVEVEIPLSVFEAFWFLTSKRRITKIRYILPGVHGRIKVDIYRDNLDGLIVAEAEFPSVEKAEKYQLEKWMLRDITLDNRYKNRALAVSQKIPEFN